MEKSAPTIEAFNALKTRVVRLEEICAKQQTSIDQLKNFNEHIKAENVEIAAAVKTDQQRLRGA